MPAVASEEDAPVEKKEQNPTEAQAPDKLNEDNEKPPLLCPLHDFRATQVPQPGDTSLLSVEAKLTTHQKTAGIPTALCVNKKWCCVGTSRSLVLCWVNGSSKVKFVLGFGKVLKGVNEVVPSEQTNGAVTAIVISPGDNAKQHNYLIIGYSSGCVEFWDFHTIQAQPNTKPTLLKTYPKQHQQPVIFLSLLPLNQSKTAQATDNAAMQYNRVECLALSLDTRGCCTVLCLKKRMFLNMFETKVLLDGKNGRVSAIDLDNITGMVALASQNDVFFIAFQPNSMEAKVQRIWKPDVETKTETEDSDAVCLAFGQARIGQSNTTEHVLARAKGKTLDFTQVQYNTSPSEKNTIQYEKYNTEHCILSIHWLNESTVIVLTADFKLSCIDVCSFVKLESTNIQYTQVVWTNIYKTTQRSFHNTIVRCNTAQRSSDTPLLCLLGIEGVFTVNAKRWFDRVLHCVASNQWLQALSLSLENHTQYNTSQRDKIQYSKTNRNNTKLIDLITSYAKQSDGGRTEIAVCVEYCIELDRIDVLWGVIYDVFIVKGVRNSFLDVLYSYIVHTLIANVSPVVLRDLVEFIIQEDTVKYNTRRLELLLLNLDINTIRSDLDTLIKLTIQYQLWRPLIHLYCIALQDWETPIRKLLTSKTPHDTIQQIIQWFIAEYNTVLQNDPLWESKCLMLCHEHLAQQQATALALDRLLLHSIPGGLPEKLMSKVMTTLLMNGNEEECCLVLDHVGFHDFKLEELKTHVKAYGWKNALFKIAEKELELAQLTAGNGDAIQYNNTNEHNTIVLQGLGRVQQAFKELVDLSEKPASYCIVLFDNPQTQYKEVLYTVVQESLKRLYALEPEETTRLVLEYNTIQHVDQLKAFPKLQYLWLTQKQDIQYNTIQNVTTEQDTLQYLELMCQVDPNNVLLWVKSKETSVVLCDIMVVLEKYTGVKDALAYVLYCVGDVDKAIRVALNEIENRYINIQQDAIQYNTIQENKGLDRLLNMVSLCIELLEKNSVNSLDPTESHKLWFKLFDKCSSTTQYNTISEENGDEYNNKKNVVSQQNNMVLQKVLNSMMLFVPAEKVLKAVRYNTCGQVRKTVEGMLRAKCLDHETLKLTKKLNTMDMLHLVKNKHDLLLHGKRYTKMPQHRTTSQYNTIRLQRDKKMWFVNWGERLKKLGEHELDLGAPL